MEYKYKASRIWFTMHVEGLDHGLTYSPISIFWPHYDTTDMTQYNQNDTWYGWYNETSGKFLGYLVTQRRIEVNPDLISAILSMKSPTCVKEVQMLKGRLAALNRFLSRFTDKCKLFFQVIKRNRADFYWNEDCEAAFQGLKNYLASPRRVPRPEELSCLSSSPIQARHRRNTIPLSCGIRVNREWSLGLGRGGVQKLVYYVSKPLLDVEIRYQRMKKMVLALLIVLRKLKHNFQSFRIVMLTEHPLKSIVENPQATERISKWATELKPYGIKYKSRTTIKGQVLKDFIAEFTPRASAQSDLLDGWILNIDGASNNKGSGIGIVLTTSEGTIIE